MPKPFRAFVLAAALVALPQLSAGQTVAETNANLDQIYGEHAPYQAFFRKLQKAVAANDKAAVAGLKYPFETKVGGESVTLRDAHHFVAEYDQIFTAKVRKALAAQSYASLFSNYEGLMVGDGEVWFSGIGDAMPTKVLIIAVNQWAAEAAGEGGPRT